MLGYLQDAARGIGLGDTIDKVRQFKQGLNQIQNGLGTIGDGSSNIVRGLYGVGGGTAKSFGGKAGALLGLGALGAAHMLGGGPLISLGTKAAVQVIKGGASGAKWLAKKLFSKFGSKNNHPEKLSRFKKGKGRQVLRQYTNAKFPTRFNNPDHIRQMAYGKHGQSAIKNRPHQPQLMIQQQNQMPINMQQNLMQIQ